MDAMLKWSCVAMLVLMVCAMVPAAVFNRNQFGKALDNSLRFEPRRKSFEGIVTRPQDEPVTLPKFCNKLDCPAFTVIEDKKNYQLREYVNSDWVTTNIVGVNFDLAEEEEFMRLFHYISGDNVGKRKIDMTAPVITRILPGQGPACADNFTMSFFMSTKVKNPPKPSEKDVFLSDLPKMRVFVRYFPGFATKDKWLTQAQQLASDLEKDKKDYIKGFYYTAGYNSPFQLTNRHNEIWFIQKFM